MLPQRFGASTRRPARALSVLALCLALAGLAWPAAAAAEGGRASLRQRVALRGGAVDVEIGFDEGQRAWAAYQLRHAAAYLPALEGYLGVPLRQALRGFLGKDPPAGPFRILIEGRSKVLLNGRWIGAYNNSAGLFSGPRAIFVEYNLTRLGSPALILHELAHFWLYDSAGVTVSSAQQGQPPPASWFNEGAVEVLPLAVHEAQLLPLTAEECRAIGDHNGLNRVPFPQDEPIEEDLRPRGGTQLLLFYQKAFLSHVLLRRYLGPAGYRALLARAAAAPGELANADGVLRLLRGQRELPWDRLLGGWVYRGPYGPITPAAFRAAVIAPDGAVFLTDEAGARQGAPTTVH